MTYIFFSNNKWFLHPEDLPIKPKQKEEYSYCNPSLIELENLIWDKAIADIKAKALEIANPEIIKWLDNGQGLNHIDAIHESTLFYQWPGTFEKKETLYANDKYEVKYKTEVAHLVLPPEEKNMDEMYYLNGPDEFVPNESKNMNPNYALWLLKNALRDEITFRQQAIEVLDGNEIEHSINHRATIDAFSESLKLSDERIPQLIDAIEKIEHKTP
jgi:hypothetical protein